MKISGRKSQPIAPLAPFAGPAAAESTPDASPAGGVCDQVDLGSTTQVRQLAKAANALPAVRTEKVTELRDQIDEGSYYVESDKLARKVVDETIRDLLAQEAGRNGF